MIQIDVEKTALTVRTREMLTSGMVNAVQVQFAFSPEWDGLTRVAVFYAGETVVNCLPDETGCCAVPWECLRQPGVRLMAGVYGTRNGTVVLPSEQCDLGFILPGAEPGTATDTEGSPSLAAQMIAKANEAMAVAQAVREEADAGAFAGAPGAVGTIAVGSVTSAAVGEAPGITNRGTPSAAVLDFVLPAGPQGVQGAQGIPGPQGPAGPKGTPGTDIRPGSLSLPQAAWVGDTSPYTQVVTIPGGTAASKVDVQPDATTLAALAEAGVAALLVQNEDGVFTAFAVGAKPAGDLLLPCVITELALPV